MQAGGARLRGRLVAPPAATGWVILAHEGGASLHGSSHEAVARRLNERYFLRFDRDKAALVGRQLRDIACASFAGEAAGWAPIEVPVLFINGGADRFTPPKAAAPLATLCREPSFAVVPEAGHFLAMESSEACDRVARQIRDFFLPQPARSLAVTG